MTILTKLEKKIEKQTSKSKSLTPRTGDIIANAAGALTFVLFMRNSKVKSTVPQAGPPMAGKSDPDRMRN